MRGGNRKGFTLIELMVVAIIVAILAAVAIPLMAANKKKAVMTEAQAGCGAVRTALRVYYAEHGQYPAAGTTLTAIGVAANDLDGTYFSTSDYSFSGNGNTYTINCTGNSAGSVAAKKDMAAGLSVTLTQAGEFTYGGL